MVAPSWSDIAVPDNASLTLSGNFTIEWFQKMQTNSSKPYRVFSTDNTGFPNQERFAVSYESGDANLIFTLWISGTSYQTYGSQISTLNTWTHFAIVRSGGTIIVYKNGTAIGSPVNNSTSIDPQTVIRLGNIISRADTAFKGWITNFHWLPGVVKYTSNFSRPTFPVASNSQSAILLLAQTAATLNSNSGIPTLLITNSNVTWSSDTPFKT